MKVLWTSLTTFPDLCIRLGEEPSVFCGWMHSAAQALLGVSTDLKLAVVSPKLTGEVEQYEIKGIIYYRVACKNHFDYSRRMVEDMKQVIESFKPDLIHINGTEHCIGLSLAQAARNTPLVASIQGLASVCKNYTSGGIKTSSFIRNITLRDILGQSASWTQHRMMCKRGDIEIQLFKLLQHIIGRTEWDKAHALALNSQISYYHCEESLRSTFYLNEWNINKSQQYNIFVSNGTSALKGVHQVIKALPIIIKHYPDVTLSITGEDYRSKSNFKGKIRLTGYQKYLISLINKYKLNDRVKFLGLLDEMDMCKAFLNAHVYVLPSYIENSPNSLCEAQILGVPIIASYVGGVPSLIEEEKTGLMYRFEEHEVLAQNIIKIFSSNSLDELHKNERKVASERHNKERNAQMLLNIYKKILLR